MKNVLISGLFFAAVTAAMFGTWYVLLTVYGPMMLVIWLLTCVTHGLTVLGNPAHRWYESVAALNLGLNIGLLTAGAVAIWTMIGWWTPVTGVTFVAIAYLFKRQQDRQFDHSYGATISWQ